MSADNLGPLERRGLISVLTDARHLLRGFAPGNDVWNGHSCSECGVYGRGTSEPHRPDCRGVRTYADIGAAIEMLNGRGAEGVRDGG